MVLSDKLIKIATEAVDKLDELNRKYPDLASEISVEAVERWRRQLASFVMNDAVDDAAADGGIDPLEALAQALFEKHGIEDTLEILATEHDAMMDTARLVDVVGQAAYLRVLKREAEEFAANQVSFEQTASVWQSLGRPPLGDDHWTARAVSALLERSSD